VVKTKFKVAGGTHPGRVRTNNEDAWHADGDRGFFLVVDGIGGQAAGEKAAEIAVKRIRARLERQTGTSEQRIREAIAMANNEILQTARANPQWEGMACVLTLVVLENGSAVAGHVGDSRLYLLQPGKIRKITHDHSPVGEREDRQELSETDAMRHPRRNEVYRDVGSEEHSPEDADFIEIQRFAFDSDCALLLCSDGLSDQVPSADIRKAVERNAGRPEQAVEELIEKANGAGGKDNVTIVLVEGEDFRPAPEPPASERRGMAGWTKVLLLLLPILLVLAFLAGARIWKPRVVNVPVPPKTLLVGPSQPYATLAAALAEANAGDIVEVLAGEYAEHVQLKDSVTVRSRVPRAAILRAAPLSNGPAVLAQGVSGARFSGFWIQADPQAPLTAGVVLENSTVEIDDVLITGASIGIEIRGTGSSSLRSNEIRESLAEGILVSGSATPWLSHNTITGNRGPGLRVRDTAKPTLVRNVFDGNAVEGVTPESLRDQNYLLEPKKSKKK
jgi:parallel beta-helix repeat protein